jgi:hypothetical protein
MVAVAFLLPAPAATAGRVQTPVPFWRLAAAVIDDPYGTNFYWQFESTNGPLYRETPDTSRWATNDGDIAAGTASEPTWYLVTNQPVNYAFDFDGLSDVINMPLAIGSAPMTGDATSQVFGTICFWMNLDSAANAERAMAAVKEPTQASMLSIVADMRSENDRVRVIMTIDGVTLWRIRGTANELDSAVGVWTFISVSHDGSTNGPWYSINAVRQTPTFIVSSNKTVWLADMFAASTPATGVQVGKLPGPPSIPFDGKIDAVGIFTNYSDSFITNQMIKSNPTNNLDNP